nr:MAG: hypothetical protein AM324_00210 [Candidatus Thorarchaeota archaeon SMTZ1-83]
MESVGLTVCLLILQNPFEFPSFDSIIEMADLILNLALAFAIRGYLVFVLVGFMVYVTGLSDGLAKGLVVAGVALYIVGPPVLDYFVDIVGVDPLTFEGAKIAWLEYIGMTDAEFIHTLVTIGDVIVAVAILAGAILYFTPLAGDLKSKGQSLIVRAILLTPVLGFFHVTAWL